MRRFEAVLCDLDGVLRQFDHDRQRDIEEHYGLPVLATAFAPEQIRPAILGQITAEQWLASITAALGGHPDAVRAVDAFAAVDFWVDEQVRDLLTEVRARVPLVLVTNAMDNLDIHLARMRLTDFADTVISSAAVGIAKPDLRIYEIAAEAAGVAPNRCVFIDDRPENVSAARSLGMTGIHYRGIEDLAVLSVNGGS
ncbi:HAD family hydrolase [Nocardia sp. NPDC056541]|uniref:HAD family hydrolase n=1 Tax=Nocardia sp. NPDC056541 TaxID=3345860 RepID=UPI00366DB42C